MVTPAAEATRLLNAHDQPKRGSVTAIESMIAADGAALARTTHRGTESAFALRHGERRIVGINMAISPRRQRFAAAHAWAHLLLHCANTRPLVVDHSIYLGGREAGSSIATPVEEDEANDFASAVLMPQPHLMNALTSELDAAEYDSRDALIARLARAFDVSNEAMGYRLISLNVLTA